MLNVSDKLLFLVICILGLTLFSSVVGVILLQLESKPVPDLLGQLAVGCLAGLSGLLVQRNPIQVEDK